MCERKIGELGHMAVLMIDGLLYAGECIVVALGVDQQGKKHVLGLLQGASENAAVVQGLLDDLMQRGLDAAAKRLYVLDGSKALRSAVHKTFGQAIAVQRCQIHKRCVPEALRGSLRSTNLVESAISVVRATTRRVKRWRAGDMRLRWSAAGLLAAGKGFRRIRGYKSMSVLIAKVNAFDATLANQSEAA